MNVKNVVRSAGRFFVLLSLTAGGICLSGSCSRGDSDGRELSEKFARMSDSQKVDYLIKNNTPDSVARFLCRAALNEIPGVKIDTLAMAKIYATERYQGGDLDKFMDEYEKFPDRLPLAKKLRLWRLDTMDDPMSLDYELGLKYVDYIRVGKKSSKDIEMEIADLKKECARHPEDSATFNRFKKGFEVALKEDGGRDVPNDIYRKYAGN